MLSEVLQATGDSADAARVLAQAKAVAQAVRLNDLLAQMEQQQIPVAQPSPLLAPPSDTHRATPIPAPRK
jgi:hypothetical protein